MRYIKMTFRALVLLLVWSLLHYVLPQHDIGRVTGTEIIRTDFSGWNKIFYAQADSGNSAQPTRDLRLINVEKRNTFLLGFIPRDSYGVMVYRNEDTGWIWPPYFKFDSSDLQAIASANVSTAAAPQWVVVTHYGWRNRFFSIYPNAVSIKPIASPDVTIIPWFNIGFFVFLAIAYGFVRAAWFQFRERTVDPLVDSASHKWDEVEAGAAKRTSGISRWFASWRRK